VPRAWTLYFAEMVGATEELPDALPGAWIGRASERAGDRVPSTFSEPSLRRHPADDVARRVIADVMDILSA
jgi:hypothetical protein